MNHELSTSSSLSQWRESALVAFRLPFTLVACPVCHAKAVSAAWHLTDFLSRAAEIELACSACKATAAFQITLPQDAPGFFPLDRLAKLGPVLQSQLLAIQERIQKHARTMPAAVFTTHPLWAEAKWRASTYHFHPTFEAPPVMGLVFENGEAGLEIFHEAKRQMNQEDRFEEIRISIIEGYVPGQEQRPGYSVHISPDPEALVTHATADDFVLDPAIVPFLGQWNRHYPIPGTPKMLPIFKREFEKWGQFMLCPYVHRSDGQLWGDPKLGIIKHIINFRDLTEITPDDPDVAALMLPQLITPPR